MSVSDDSIAEIFVRLPSKSLIRFRSLSKTWCSRIKSSDFIRKHASLSSQKVLIKHGNYLGLTRMECFHTLHSEDRMILYMTPGYWKIIPVTFHWHSVEVIGSCNGVLCLLNDFIITLWNPSISHQLTLSCNSIFWEIFVGQKVAAGFGYDPITNDYKIVMIFYTQTTTEQRSLLYSLNAGVWHPIAAPTISLFDIVWGCSVNGLLHWMVKEDGSHRYIMTFDLSSETFGLITLPDPSFASGKLTTINGSLAMISYDWSYSLIWVRKECGDVSSWSIIHKFKGMVSRILSLANGNLLVKSYNNEFIVYNPETRVQSRLGKFGGSCLVDIETYVESLVLVDKGVACNEY